MRYDFLKEQVRNNVIIFRYIPTDLQLADIFTKHIIGEKFFYLRDCLLGRTPTKPLPPAAVKPPEHGQKLQEWHIPPRPRGVCYDYVMFDVICKCYVCSLRICVYILFLLLWEKRRILSYINVFEGLIILRI